MPLNYSILAQPLNEPLTLAQVHSQCRIDSGFTADDPLLLIYISAARQLAEKLTRRAFLTQTWQRTLDNFPIAANYDYAPSAADHWNWPTTGGMWNRLVVDLPGGKAQSIASINYTDQNGNPQTLPSSEFLADLASTPCRIIPANLTWPFVGNIAPGAVQINYTVGSYVLSVSENFSGPNATPWEYQLLQASTLLGNLANVASLATQAAPSIPLSGWSVTPGGLLTVPVAQENVPLVVSYTIANLPADIMLALLMLVGHFYRNAEASTDLKMNELPFGVEALLSPHVVEWGDYRPC